MSDYTALSNHLRLISQLRSLEGGNPFSAKAYDKAADTIKEYDGDPELITYLPGIGEKIGKIATEFLATGSSSVLKDLEAKYPSSMMSMCAVEGIGPKTAFKLYSEGYHNLNELFQAAEDGKLDTKLTTKVKQAVNKQTGRYPYAQVISLADYLKEHMAKVPGVIKMEVGGSLRRKMPTVKDIDLLACVKNDAARVSVMEAFKRLGPSSFQGQETKGGLSFPLNGQESIHVDLWLGEENYWGSLLNHVTGSKAHNVHLRSLAKLKGWTVSEYGIFDGSNNQLGGKDEGDLYRLLGITYVEPEQRV